ncbi:MAG: 3-dehydroquinate synthase II [Halobacteriota archaeon]|nr:3-dehydroquinate synthase II [Halobacteriota archaeon]
MKKIKSVWVKADGGSWDSNKGRITGGLESGADCVLVNDKDVKKVRELGNIKVAAFTKTGESSADILVVGKDSEGDGNHPLPSDFDGSADLNLLRKLRREGKETGAYVEIRGKEYERFASVLAEICNHLIVVGVDWKVIPLENLIAELQNIDVNIIAGVKNAEEARTALETLEHGSDGVLLDTDDLSDIKGITDVAISSGVEPIPLAIAKISKLKPVGMGDRVCVDTCSLLSRGEGMLVGSQSNGMFLIHSESEESPYVAARPFRVNAGAVHAYVLAGDKTRYLSELESGDEVMVVNSDGTPRKVAVGRVKIERRPLMLVEAVIDGNKIKTVLQNAETIKLVSKDGTPISITELKEGDEVLVRYEDAARHFGIKIDETIIEK